MALLDSVDAVGDFLDAAFPAVLLVSTSAWLPSAVLLLGCAARAVRVALTGDETLPRRPAVPSLAGTDLSAAVVGLQSHLAALVVVPVAFAVGENGRLHGLSSPITTWLDGRQRRFVRPRSYRRHRPYAAVTSPRSATATSSIRSMSRSSAVSNRPWLSTMTRQTYPSENTRTVNS